MTLAQELNERRLTLVEGSALSERDLVRTRAHSGSAILLLADRFSPSAHQEDLGLQFQVCISPSACTFSQLLPVSLAPYNGRAARSALMEIPHRLGCLPWGTPSVLSCDALRIIPEL